MELYVHDLYMTHDLFAICFYKFNSLLITKKKQRDLLISAIVVLSYTSVMNPDFPSKLFPKNPQIIELTDSRLPLTTSSSE